MGDIVRMWLRRLVLYNPLYALSALLLVYGCYYITGNPALSGDGLTNDYFTFATCHVYELIIFAVGLFVLYRRQLWRDTIMLGVIFHVVRYAPLLLGLIFFIDPGGDLAYVLLGGTILLFIVKNEFMAWYARLPVSAGQRAHQYLELLLVLVWFPLLLANQRHELAYRSWQFGGWLLLGVSALLWSLARVRPRRAAAPAGAGAALAGGWPLGVSAAVNFVFSAILLQSMTALSLGPVLPLLFLPLVLGLCPVAIALLRASHPADGHWDPLLAVATWLPNLLTLGVSFLPGQCLLEPLNRWWYIAAVVVFNLAAALLNWRRWCGRGERLALAVAGVLALVNAFNWLACPDGAFSRELLVNYAVLAVVGVMVYLLVQRRAGGFLVATLVFYGAFHERIIRCGAPLIPPYTPGSPFLVLHLALLLALAYLILRRSWCVYIAIVATLVYVQALHTAQLLTTATAAPVAAIDALVLIFFGLTRDRGLLWALLVQVAAIGGGALYGRIGELIRQTNRGLLAVIGSFVLIPAAVLLSLYKERLLALLTPPELPLKTGPESAPAVSYGESAEAAPPGESSPAAVTEVPGHAVAPRYAPPPVPRRSSSSTHPLVLLLGVFLLFCLVLMGARVFSGLIHGGEGRSKVGAAAGDIGAVNSALALYQVDLKSQVFPVVSLMQLISDAAPGWSGPYMATITNDPWNNAYVYTGSAGFYTVQSKHKSDYGKAETIRYCFGTGMMESLP